MCRTPGVGSSGCTNSCGQHHASDIGFFGAERRAHGRAAPGYQMLLGGYIGQEQAYFGEKALRLPAKAAPDAAVRVVRRFADERTAGETFRGWMDRVGRCIGDRRRPEGPRLSSRRRTRRPSTTPTSTRPARSWPKSASRSARPEPLVTRRRWRRSTPPTPTTRTIVEVRGRQAPLALIHGQLAAEWIERLVDDPDETLLLAARAHHLRRWELPRGTAIPIGRAGYLRWRRDQKARHADRVAAILEPYGY